MTDRVWETLLRRAGFVLMAVTTVVFGAFVVGDTVTDPGGWAAVGLIALWAVPMAALCALAWLRPDWATRVLGVLAGVLVVASVWFAVAPGAFRDFENQHGPVRAIAVWVVAVAAALLGLKRTMAAGILLLVIGGVPFLIASFRFGGFASLAVVTVPAVIAGVLYLYSAVLASRAGSDGVIPPGPARPGR